MDARVSQLETHMEYAIRDIAEIKSGVKTMTEAITSLTIVTTQLSAKLDTSIANLSAKLDTSIANLSAKLDTSIANLSAKLEASDASFAAKLEASNASFSAKLEASNNNISTKFEAYNAKIDAVELKLSNQMSLLPTKNDLKNYNLQYTAIGFAIFILVVGGIVGGLDWIKIH